MFVFVFNLPYLLLSTKLQKNVVINKKNKGKLWNSNYF